MNLILEKSSHYYIFCKEFIAPSTGPLRCLITNISYSIYNILLRLYLCYKWFDNNNNIFNSKISRRDV